MLERIRHYLSLIKFSHTIFALPFALIGFTLGVMKMRGAAELNFPLLFVEVLMCMVFARSAAMSFNRWLDRKFDALNPRTASREIPAGVIKENNALTFVIINSVLFIATTWFINPLCFYLSFVALFVILFYSYTKRFTALCHLVLGTGLSLAPIGAYIAVTNEFHLIPILFSFSVFTWVAGFDIIYALQDEEFDKSQHLHSIPAALGKKNALLTSTLLHIASGIFIIAAGYLGGLHWMYWIGSTFYCAMLVYQHMLVKPHDLSKVNLAFMTTNGFASVIFAIFTIISIIIG
jgi:4-hydroxybenzoate polyprenyltransferase